MEEALHDVSLLRGFAGLCAFEDVIPNESTILCFRHGFGAYRGMHDGEGGGLHDDGGLSVW